MRDLSFYPGLYVKIQLQPGPPIKTCLEPPLYVTDEQWHGGKC